MSSNVIAIGLSLTGATCINLGLILQKKSTTLPQNQGYSVWKQKLWLVGLTIFLSGHICVGLAFTQGAQSFVSALSNFSLITNLFFATAILGEERVPLHYVVACLVTLGIMLAIISVPEIPEDSVELSNEGLGELASAPSAIVVYIFVITVLVVTGIRRRKLKAKKQLEEEENMRLKKLEEELEEQVMKTVNNMMDRVTVTVGKKLSNEREMVPELQEIDSKDFTSESEEVSESGNLESNLNQQDPGADHDHDGNIVNQARKSSKPKSLNNNQNLGFHSNDQSVNTASTVESSFAIAKVESGMQMTGAKITKSNLLNAKLVQSGGDDGGEEYQIDDESSSGNSSMLSPSNRQTEITNINHTFTSNKNSMSDTNRASSISNYNNLQNQQQQFNKLNNSSNQQYQQNQNQMVSMTMNSAGVDSVGTTQTANLSTGTNSKQIRANLNKKQGKVAAKKKSAGRQTIKQATVPIVSQQTALSDYFLFNTIEMSMRGNTKNNNQQQQNDRGPGNLTRALTRANTYAQFDRVLNFINGTPIGSSSTKQNSTLKGNTGTVTGLGAGGGTDNNNNMNSLNQSSQQRQQSQQQSPRNKSDTIHDRIMAEEEDYKTRMLRRQMTLMQNTQEELKKKYQMLHTTLRKQFKYSKTSLGPGPGQGTVQKSSVQGTTQPGTLPDSNMNQQISVSSPGVLANKQQSLRDTSISNAQKSSIGSADMNVGGSKNMAAFNNIMPQVTASNNTAKYSSRYSDTANSAAAVSSKNLNVNKKAVQISDQNLNHHVSVSSFNKSASTLESRSDSNTKMSDSKTPSASPPPEHPGISLIEFMLPPAALGGVAVTSSKAMLGLSGEVISDGELFQTFETLTIFCTLILWISAAVLGVRMQILGVYYYGALTALPAYRGMAFLGQGVSGFLFYQEYRFYNPLRAVGLACAYLTNIAAIIVLGQITKSMKEVQVVVEEDDDSENRGSTRGSSEDLEGGSESGKSETSLESLEDKEFQDFMKKISTNKEPSNKGDSDLNLHPDEVNLINNYESHPIIEDIQKKVSLIDNHLNSNVAPSKAEIMAHNLMKRVTTVGSTNQNNQFQNQNKMSNLSRSTKGTTPTMSPNISVMQQKQSQNQTVRLDVLNQVQGSNLGNQNNN